MGRQLSFKARVLSRQSEEELLAGFVRKTSVECTHYRVNLQSANFGECMCGMPKADHSEEALKENSENRATAMTTRRDEVELRKTFVQREKVECAKYEVDMSPGALYGMCICGKPRAEHTEEALQGSKHEAKGRRSEAEVRAQMAARAAAAEVASAPKPAFARFRSAPAQAGPKPLNSLSKARRIMS